MRKRGVETSPADAAARRSFLQSAALGGLLAGSGSLVAPGPAHAQGTAGEDALQRVIKNKQINIAVVIYPPLTIKQGGELSGTFIEAAKWLLIEAGEKIEAAALRVGLHDASHLSRLFVRYAGTRPGAYRRSIVPAS